MIFKKEYTACPNCKSKECVHEYDYLTYSEKLECSNCKYKISFTYITDENGNTIKLDDNMNLTLKNLINKRFLSKVPCGIVINQNNDGEIIGNAIMSEIHQYKTLINTDLYRRHHYTNFNATLYRLLDNKMTVDVLYEKEDNYDDDLPF